MKQEIDNRIRKSWWAVTEFGVRKVVGYSCAPHNPDSWWCPEVGYSLNEKHHLFETEREALVKNWSKIDTQIDELTMQRDKLIYRITEIDSK